MMSISALGNATEAAGYYMHLTDAEAQAEDYYSMEGVGLWTGQGAAALGLSGEVSRVDFVAISRGENPQDGALTQRSGDQHRAGWDATLSAPKSISSMWARADAPTRRAIEDAHRAAVAAALSYVQDRAGTSRCGHGAEHQDNDVERRRAAGLVIATYEHKTSRATDPQIHTHCVIFNIAVREDGTTGAVDPRPLYQHKMAAGAAYRAEFAYRLRQVGYGIKAGDKGTFQVAGVPENLTAADSTRRAEIEARLERTGGQVGDAKASETAALRTRSGKQHVPIEELRVQWAAKAHEVAPEWSPSDAHGAGGDERQSLPTAREVGEQITQQSSVFRARDVERLVFERAPLAGADLHESRMRAANILGEPDKGGIIQLFDRTNGQKVDAYTTVEMLAIERGIVARGERMAANDGHQVSRMALAVALDKAPTLSNEQREMVRHVAAAGDTKLVQGTAGTGKSFALGVARHVWEAEGYRVRGAALSGKAAEGLQTGSGIESKTIARTLMDALPWTGQQGRQHEATDPFTSRDVIVVDEAAMVDSRSLDKLTGMAEQAGAKVVLVGDTRQLQAISAGAPFRDLQERLGYSELSEIRRQRDPADVQVVKDLAAGRADDAIQSLDERGRIHVSKDLRSATAAAGRAVADDTIGGKRSLALAATNAAVCDINEAAREQMRAAGALGQDRRVQTTRGQRNFAEGDRLLFLKNAGDLDVRNGDFGTVLTVGDHKDGTVILTVELDRGGTRCVETSQYADIDHGYAATGHKSQGATVDTVHVYSDGSGMESKEWAYVAASRAKDETHVYTDADTKEGLGKTWSRNGEKESTQDYSEQDNSDHESDANVKDERQQGVRAGGSQDRDSYETDPAAPGRADDGADAKAGSDAQPLRESAVGTQPTVSLDAPPADQHATPAPEQPAPATHDGRAAADTEPMHPQASGDEPDRVRAAPPDAPSREQPGWPARNPWDEVTEQQREFVEELSAATKPAHAADHSLQGHEYELEKETTR